MTSKNLLIKRKEGARAQKGYLYKMPAILLSTFPKFSTSSCGKQPARLELPARLVPGLPSLCWQCAILAVLFLMLECQARR